MDNRPIGIFDSGVGGLTVFSELKKVLPGEDMIYLGDTKQFPYGNKSKDTIIELSKKNIEFLMQKNVKAIVIACGTATSQALESVRDSYNIPIIGIIHPTILELANDKNTTRIGVIATTGTIRSNSWEIEIKKAMPNVEVINKACPLLAQMAEEGWTENEIAKLTIHEYLKKFKEEPVEKLILGCTHYPLFRKLIEEELGEGVEIIDTGKNVGKFLKQFLEKENMENQTKKIPEYQFYLTDMETEFVRVARNLLQKEVKIMQKGV